jgi:hypothetical protein
LNLDISARSGADLDTQLDQITKVRPETVRRYVDALAK